MPDELSAYDFRERRALPGKGKLKAALLKSLWHAENDITHFIIAFIAGRDSIQDQKRKDAEIERSAIIADLLACTKESK